MHHDCRMHNLCFFYLPTAKKNIFGSCIARYIPTPYFDVNKLQ